jgi:general secretion pathway protein G
MRMQQPRSPGRRAARGMTLIEIVIVIVLIGGILAVVGSRIVGNKARAEHKLAQTQVQTLLEKVQQYEGDVGALPASLDALVTKPGNADGWLGPYAKESELKDPWKTPIELRRAGDAGFELVSLGADRKAGGEGVDGDIVVSP